MSKTSKRKHQIHMRSGNNELLEFNPFDGRHRAQIYGLSELGPTMSKIGTAVCMPLSRQIQLQFCKLTIPSVVDCLKGLSGKIDLERFVVAFNHEAPI